MVVINQFPANVSKRLAKNIAYIGISDLFDGHCHTLLRMTATKSVVLPIMMKKNIF